MPEKIILEDGSEREIPTAEEIAALQEKATAFESLSSEKTKLENQLKELEEGVNPNWREVRAKQKQLETVISNLKSQGKIVEEDGTIKDHQAPVAPEDVRGIAAEEAAKITVQNHVDSKLNKYDSETRALVNKYYKKLINGEKVDMSNVDEFLTSAEKAAGISSSVDPLSRFQSASGSGPRESSPKKEAVKRGVEVAGALGYRIKNKDKFN